MLATTGPVIHAAFDRVRFNLHLEDEMKGFADKQYFYESDVAYAFLSYVRPGDVCIDAGANLGYHTIFLSQLVGDKGAVLAFEPDPTHYAKLKANLELNEIKNVHAYPHALLNMRGELNFFSYPGGGYSSFVPFQGSHRISVPTFTLDEILLPYVPVRMIKIDCEGSEERILHGAKESLARIDCVIMEFNYSIMPIFGSTDRSIRNYMDEQGFDFFVLRRDGSEPVNVPLDLEIKMEGKTPHMFNGLFVRRGISA